MKLNEESFAPADDETEGGGAGVALVAAVLLGICAFLVFAALGG